MPTSPPNIIPDALYLFFTPLYSTSTGLYKYSMPMPNKNPFSTNLTPAFAENP